MSERPKVHNCGCGTCGQEIQSLQYQITKERDRFEAVVRTLTLDQMTAAEIERSREGADRIIAGMRKGGVW